MRSLRISAGLILSLLLLSACSKEKFGYKPAPVATATAAPAPNPQGPPSIPPPRPPIPPPAPPIFVQPPPPPPMVRPVPMQTEFEFFGEEMDFEIFASYEVFFLNKRIVFLGMSDEFTKEAYQYQTLFLSYLYRHGFRHIGFEQSPLPAVSEASMNTPALRVQRAKGQALLKERQKVQAFLRRLDGHRPVGQAPLKVFHYQAGDQAQIQQQMAQLEPGEKLILIGHDLSLSRTPSVLSQTYPQVAASPSTIGSTVADMFPAQILSVWMMSHGGTDSNPACADRECEMDVSDLDISYLLRATLPPIPKAMYLFSSHVLPGPLDQSYDFQTDQGNIRGELKLNADLILYVENIHALSLDRRLLRDDGAAN